MNDYEKKLRQGLEKINITISNEKIFLLLNYLEEFYKWNKAYNLSAVRDKSQMLTRHLLDSLVLVSHFEKFCEKYQQENKKIRVIDVGTGGGLPGIPLAIVFPEANFVLLDSNGKKTRFLFQVKTRLKLDNVHVENSRIESYEPEEKFDMVVSRAFATINDMVNGSQHLLLPSGEYWAMKGIYPENELRESEKQVIVDAVIPLSVPDTEGERHVAILKPKQNESSL